AGGGGTRRGTPLGGPNRTRRRQGPRDGRSARQRNRPDRKMRTSSMQLQQIPRTIVRTWLRTARLPLDAVEAVVRRGEHDVEWPPAIAFDSFEAAVKQFAGSLLHDDELTQDGQVAGARVAALRKAVELE